MSNRIQLLSMIIGFATLSVAIAAKNVVAQENSKPQATKPSDRVSTIADLKTVAEKSNYSATSLEKDVLEFVAELDRFSPFAKQFDFARTTENRPLHGLLIAKDENVSLPLAPNDPRLVIVIIGNIHSGECDSKEALLALSRDLLKDAKPKYLDRAVIAIIPNFNADGNERTGLLHRPGQEGPENGMGTRENAVGLDLNRDFIKLDTPEVRGLVRLMDSWDADVLIDCHTTNGSLHRYDMTYDLSHNPAADQRIIKWVRTSLFPDLTSDLQKRGIPSFYYGNFSEDHTRWESYGHEGRYSTEYMGLRGKLGILVESYSYASYERRIEATYHFVNDTLQRLTDNANQLKSWTHSSVKQPTSVPIQGKIGTDGQPVVALGYAWANDVAIDADGKSKPRGKFPSPKDRKQPDAIKPAEYKLELHNVGQPVLQVDAPEYYFVPADNAWAASRLRMHGIELIWIDGTDRELASGSIATHYKIESRKELPPFQKHAIQKFSVLSEKGVWQPTAGWLVPSAQPLGTLLTYLLEPHSDDSLAVWNFFDPQLKEGQTYPVVRIEKLPSSNKLPKPLPKMGLKEIASESMAKEELTLPKLYDPARKVSYSSVPTPIPTWVPDRSEYLWQHDNRWFAVDCETGAMTPFTRLDRLTAALARHEAIGESQAKSLSQRLSVFDEQFKTAMIEYKNDLFVYRTDTDEVQKVTDTPDAREELAELSPTGNHVAFVLDNNLWIADSKTRERKQLTTDGATEILNGKLDWVYQEEVYGRGKFKGYWWSPDGGSIAFLRLDETPVPRFQIPNSLPFAQSVEEMRYPKAGQNNPLVSIHVIDIQTGARQEIPLANYPELDRIIARVMWHPTNVKQVVVQVQNRIQSKLDVLSYDVESKVIKELVRESSNAWVDVNDQPRFLPDGSFLWLSDASGRRHVERITANGDRIALTSGDWDVKEILAVTHTKDNVLGKIWITGHRSKPVNTDVLLVDIDSGKIESIGETNDAHRATVHPSGEFYFDSFSNAETQGQTWLCKKDGSKLRYVGGYRSDRFDYVKAANTQLFEIQARDGFPLQSILYTPTNFEERKPERKYPVLIHVYGGPSAPTVENAWTHRNDLWHRYLAEQGIIVLFCDNRSALGKGNADTWKIYRNLGALELRDLEDAVGWLKSQSWVDGDHIGMWGWSYGGYFTAYSMTHSKLFAAGISGAPVTDWRNYDSIYTERYMGLPDANSQGYKTSSVIEAAKDLSGRLLLIHGEIDDNVHMANTMQFAHALQQAGKPFELMIYPNNRHGITNPNQSYHQFQMMTDFLERTLKEKK